MNKKKILVCSLCHSLNYYDNYAWMCPICEQTKKRRMISDKKGNRHSKLNSEDINEKEKIRYIVISCRLLYNTLAPIIR